MKFTSNLKRQNIIKTKIELPTSAGWWEHDSSSDERLGGGCHRAMDPIYPRSKRPLEIYGTPRPYWGKFKICKSQSARKPAENRAHVLIEHFQTRGVTIETLPMQRGNIKNFHFLSLNTHTHTHTHINTHTCKSTPVPKRGSMTLSSRAGLGIRFANNAERRELKIFSRRKENQYRINVSTYTHSKRFAHFFHRKSLKEKLFDWRKYQPGYTGTMTSGTLTPNSIANIVTAWRN